MRTVLIILAFGLLPYFEASAQSQFTSSKADRGKFRGEVTYARTKPTARPAVAWNPTDPTSWNAGQRQTADALWEQERAARLAREAAARERQDQREPTAWEKVYSEEQAQRAAEKEALIRHLEKVRAERKKRQQQAMKRSEQQDKK